eukprot:163112-Chlamydomonas_euryale.AAC.1
MRGTVRAPHQPSSKRTCRPAATHLDAVFAVVLVPGLEVGARQPVDDADVEHLPGVGVSVDTGVSVGVGEVLVSWLELEPGNLLTMPTPSTWQVCAQVGGVGVKQVWTHGGAHVALWCTHVAAQQIHTHTHT